MPVTNYFYDGDQVLQEYDDAGVVQKEYTWAGGGSGQLLSVYDGTSERYFEPDALGSTDALADQSQTVVDRWRYRAFGAATQTVGTDITPFVWVGGQGYVDDSETDLYFLHARYYDPRTIQFLSRDAFQFPQSDANPYRYAGNRPTMVTDPSGLRPNQWDQFYPLLIFENAGSLLPSPLMLLVQSLTCPLYNLEVRNLTEILNQDSQILVNPSPLTRLAIAAKLQQCYAYFPPPSLNRFLPGFCDELLKIGKARITDLENKDYRKRERAARGLLEFILGMFRGCGGLACELASALDNLKDPEAIERRDKLYKEAEDIVVELQPYWRACREATRIGLGCLGGGGFVSTHK